ncbi:unnamed protein product [Allacma fusca]|uniref:Alpha-(1,6)-fucosyltransferase n=1 Tax=Allacma fusca TaxID=39272 RepID=A0A8J2PLW0_9HEXA|nr:unnamed protein product [Allacma fusca]
MISMTFCIPRRKYISRIRSVAFAILALWFFSIGLFYVLPTNYPNEFSKDSSQGSSDTAHIIQRIDSLFAELKVLKINNMEMKKILGNANPEGAAALAAASLAANAKDWSFGLNDVRSAGEPLEAYEKTRRSLEYDLKELWYNIRSRQGNLDENDLAQMQDVYRTLRSHLIKLRAADGYEAFREQETAELATLVQDRLHVLQNPKHCDTAKKLVCNLNKGCGFGCQVHHVCYCLVVAYATGRTLILESRGWRYNRQGWEQIFLPVSDTCTFSGTSKRDDFASGKTEDSRVVQLPIVDFLKPKPDYLPISIPADIADRLEKVHGEPHIWWVGQFMKFLLRLQPQFQNIIDSHVSKLGVSSPTVGIHVRRTDKIGTEASLHSLKEYMVHAEEYFSIMEKVHGQVKRRVFIASDEPSVIAEAMNSYPRPEWEILGDAKVAQSASMGQRYNGAGLVGILKDVFVLAECDFVVCTFSSQVCRLAYELIQAKHTDASERFVSLDDVYYYGGGNGLVQVATAPHKPRNDEEIELKVGDKIGVAGNHWNGMSKGTNQRTHRKGLYPSYKARNLIQRVSFPKVKWWLQAAAAD